jgi:hypothetical protein
MKVIKRGVICTEEMSEDFEKIASSLKEMSAWFWIMALAGEEICQDQWDQNIKELEEISATQGEMSAMFDKLGKSMAQYGKSLGGAN